MSRSYNISGDNIWRHLCESHTGTNNLDKFVEVVHGSAVGFERLDDPALQIARPSPHPGPFRPCQQRRHHLRHATARHRRVVAERCAEAPQARHSTRIHLLVPEEGAARHGHAAGHPLDDGPPAGVRDERAHRRVPQHRGLRRPRHQEPGAIGLGAVHEPRREQRPRVLPKRPQVGRAAGLEPGGQLTELVRWQRRDRAEADVRHGARGAVSEPGKAGVGVVGWRGGAREEVVGADGEGVGERVGEGGGHVLREEAREGVERDGGGGAGQALRHAAEEEAHDTVHVAAGADAAEGEVADAVAPEAWVGGQKLVGPVRGCRCADACGATVLACHSANCSACSSTSRAE